MTQFLYMVKILFPADAETE